ncbi:mediator of RNA polymerase II transcription subunit 33A [Dorcoceras hygrometricum]|uniref:Mediator of RNA polymerase II transcription subunit 33A n=1 Tax=Dorcoceras hygrometricum TaxID=472368 RepID=A0A2Z7CGY1_9LAMI|nr:mediator of RNA polymerase II transcription subunit 33A [Dorcoceras hygrometricum]
MALSLVYLPTISLALTFVCICKASLTDKICSQASNPSLCKRTLTSDPRHRTEDLRVLGEIIIDKSIPATLKVKTIAKKYRKGSPIEISRADECIQLASDSSDALRECKSLIKSHNRFNISTLGVTASAAMTNLETCNDDYGKREPAEIKLATGVAKDLISPHNQIPRSVGGQVSAWSSLLKGSPLTPTMVNTLVSTPATSLVELERLYEITVSSSDDQKVSAAIIFCGASLSRGWNVQEHTAILITRLLSPAAPVDFSGSESHLIGYAPFLNVLLVGISSVDSVQIFSLHGLAPQLAAALMPICEVFGSCARNMFWTLDAGEKITSHAVFSNAFTLLLRLWRFDRPPLDNVMGDFTPVRSHLTPEYLLLVHNSQLASLENQPNNQNKTSGLSRLSRPSLTEPIVMDSFPKLKRWYRQHQECIASILSALVPGNYVHQIVEALLNMMFRKLNIGGQPLTPTTSGSSSSSASETDNSSSCLKLPAWDILEAVPFVLDAALTACDHGQLSPRDLTTGLKDLADFLPASLATIVSYFSSEVTRGLWKPAFMNGSDWPSPAANLSLVEEQINRTLAATGVNIPCLSVGGNYPVTIPLPLAALVSLTITYKLDKSTDRFLNLVGPALLNLSICCPWPCMSIIAALWAQKVKRWADFLIFSASQAVFHHNSDAAVQLLKVSFTTAVGLKSPSAGSNGGVGALLGHGFGSHIVGGLSAVAPGLLYLRVHRAVRNVMFMTEEIVCILVHTVGDIANSGVPAEKMEHLKKTNCSMKYGQVSLASAMIQIKTAASLAASLVWITGGLNLVQMLIKETLPSWLISSMHQSEKSDKEAGGVVAMMCGYALAYFTLFIGTFAWGVDLASPASKRRPKVLEKHLEFLASALDGKISVGCNKATWRAYVTGYMNLIVCCTPAWMLEIDVEVLKRVSNGLKQWKEEELAVALLAISGPPAMAAAAEMIIETGI